MGMYALRSEIAYHRRNFPRLGKLNPVQYRHFTSFVSALRSCEEYVYKSHEAGDFVPGALEHRHV